MSDRWFAVARDEELPVGGARECVADGRIVAIFRTAEALYALDGICPHQGGPLGKGKLAGCIITCPWHGWQFDVATGQHQASKSIVHTRWLVKSEAGEIWVSPPDEAPA